MVMRYTILNANITCLCDRQTVVYRLLKNKDGSFTLYRRFNLQYVKIMSGTKKSIIATLNRYFIMVHVENTRY